MKPFTLIGRVVTHTARPRFAVWLKPQPNGSFAADNDAVKWVDDPPTDARTLARLMREAGDFFATEHKRDWIQETCIARANALELTSYAIAKRTGGAVSEDHVRAYLERRKSMGSHKLQHVLRVLGLTVEVSD